MYRNIKCKKRNTGEKIKFQPQPHQIKVVNHIINSTEKGLLIYHSLGSGKSCTSILTADKMIIDGLIKHRNENIYVISPASLRQNFIQEYCYKCGYDPFLLDKKFIFLSYNTGAVLKKLPRNFNNSLVIIDEAHNLINGKRNGSKVFSTIYDRLINSKNNKVLLLSATPFKKLEDIPLLINLLKPHTFRVAQFLSLLKEKTIKIDGQYINIKVPIDENYFLKEFSNIISYYKPPVDKDVYPERIDMPLQMVIMSNEQKEELQNAINWEKIQRMPRENLLYTNPEKYYEELGFFQVANKNIRSRSASNFIYPHLEIELPDHIVSKGGWVENKIFEPLKLSTIYSPKFYLILKNILQHVDEKHVIYSALKTKSGVYLLQALLELCGIKSLLYSGDITSDEKREELLKKFNNRNNLYGQRYKVMLITEAGGEGITLKAVQNIHIVESDKNEAKIQQVIGRAIRYKSHIDLPEKHRFCRVYRYFSTYDNFQGGIDLKLYINGLQKETQKKVFLDLFQKRSI